MSGPWERFTQAEAGPWQRFEEAKPQLQPAPEGDPVARVVGSGIRGVNQALYGAGGAILDAAALPFEGSAALTNTLGLSSGPSVVGQYLRKGAQGLRDAPDALANTAGAALGIAPQDFTPKTRAEKVAGKVGEYTGNVLSTLLPATAVARGAQAGTVTQGVAQALASQPAAQLAAGVAGGATEGYTDSAIAGTAASLATPLALAGMRRSLTPVGNRLSDQENRLIAAAQQEGIPLTPAQATGNPTLKTAEATMATLPLSSGPMERTFRNQRQAFNRAVLERAGIQANEASPDTLNRAFAQIGQEFDNLSAQTVVNVDRQFAQDIADVTQRYGRRLDSNVSGVFRSYIEDIYPALQQAAQPNARPQIAGDIYKNMREDLGRSIRGAGQNPPLQRALQGIQDALDDAVERSTSGGLRDAWQDVRRRYSALMTVDRAMQGGTQADRAAGNIPFGGLKQAVQQSDPRGFSRGRGQLNELARIGEYLSNKVPDSGTVPRGQMTNLLTGGALFGGASTLGAGLPAAAGAALTPWAASRLYNSPLMYRYLTNQAVQQPLNLQSLYGAQAAQGLLSP